MGRSPKLHVALELLRSGEGRATRGQQLVRVVTCLALVGLATEVVRFHLLVDCGLGPLQLASSLRPTGLMLDLRGVGLPA